MTKLDEQFDEKFVFNKGKYDCFIGNSSDDTVLPSEVKQFYNQKISELFDGLLKNGHGGGNWRRLIIQLKENYVDTNTKN